MIDGDDASDNENQWKIVGTNKKTQLDGGGGRDSTWYQPGR